MKRLFSLVLCLLTFVLLVSCEKDFTVPLQNQLKLQDVRVHLTVGHFSDTCTVSYRDGDYLLSDFSLPALHDLSVRISDGEVEHTLTDLSLSPVSDGVDGFLHMYRLLHFLQLQEYRYRDAEQENDLCFSFSFEGESVRVFVAESGELRRVDCAALSIEIREGNG